MAGTRYVIPDEPLPGRLERWIVDPLWPLLAQMFGGSWLSLPWFVFNGIALGSATRRREWALAAASLLGSAVLLAALFVLAGRVELDRASLQLLLLPLLALKLAIAYALYLMQARSFELWRHFGGVPRNAVVVIVASLFVEVWLFKQVITWLPLQLVLE
jgi:hypothetical protein